MLKTLNTTHLKQNNIKFYTYETKNDKQFMKVYILLNLET